MNEAQTENLLRRTFRGSRDALMQRAIDEPDLTWRVLVTLNGFRLFVATLLLILFFGPGEPRVFGDSYPTLFAATATGYLVFATVLAVMLRQRWAPIAAVGFTQVVVDIIAVIILTHASGGISSGLGGVPIGFIRARNLLLPYQ